MRKPKKNKYYKQFSKMTANNGINIENNSDNDSDNDMNDSGNDSDNIVIENNEIDNEQEIENNEIENEQEVENNEIENEENIENDDTTDSELVILNKLKDMENTLNSQMKDMKKMVKDLKTIKREYNKKTKELTKQIKQAGKKKKNKDLPKREPTGFNKPSNISLQLANFLNVPEDILLARTQVTKLVTQYIKDNDLRDKQNKRKILPNKQLQELFTKLDNTEVKEMIVTNISDYPGIPREIVNKNGKEVQIVKVTDKQTGYTYFNLQKYLKHHFS